MATQKFSSASPRRAPACVGPGGDRIIGKWWAAMNARDRAHIERALVARWLYSASSAEWESPRVPKRKRFAQPPISETEREYMGLGETGHG